MTGSVHVTDWFVPLSDPTAAAGHVLACPAAGGGCATFADLADRLAPEIAVWGLNLPARQARFSEPPRTTLAPLLDELVAGVPAYGPVVLFGYCSGALLAFLLADRLSRHGSTAPAAVVVASCPAPDRVRPPPNLHRLASDDFWQHLLAYQGIPAAVVQQPDFRDIYEVALRADFELFADYRYADRAPLETPIIAIFGTADPVLEPADIAGWRRHTTRLFHSVGLPGDHWLLDRNAARISEILRATLRHP